LIFENGKFEIETANANAITLKADGWVQGVSQLDLFRNGGSNLTN